MQNTLTRVFPGLVGVVALVCLSGCESPYVPPPLPQSHWGGQYGFTYPLAGPTAPAASVPVTIAVVNPNYKVEDSALDMLGYRKIGKGFAASMGTDLDKILISKGITTMGPFPSLDEMTYSDKKSSSLTLAPQVFINVEIKKLGLPRQIGDPVLISQGGNPVRAEQDFAMNVTGWISFIMQEPLSGEKMWIKKLEIDPVTVNGVIATESTPQVTPGGLFSGPIINGYTVGPILFDGRPDALADALKQIYGTVISQFEKYIDANELIALRDKSKEIRASNVFIGK